VVAEAAGLTKVPEGIADKHAALCKMAQEAAWVLERIRVEPADRVLITGVGSAGLLILEHLREAGCSAIVCVDTVAQRLQIAAALGASHVLRADDPELQDKINDATNGGPSIAIDTSGVAGAIMTCFAVVARFGQIGLFGRPHEDIAAFRIEDIVHKILTVVGLKCPPETYTRPRTLATLGRIGRGVIHADKIVTHEFPLAEINEAFAAAVNHEGLKILVRCN
ncbi:MAG: zinc-binding dehydrogenase, partial [Bacillota bacterium]